MAHGAQAAQERVTLARESDVRRWCAHFGCSEARLHRAIKAVGTDPERILDYFLAHGRR
jgi:hypothetical protein